MNAEEAGNCIKIGKTYIPAKSIHVEEIFGVYFEILFSDASLWAIEQYIDGAFKTKIFVTEYPLWGITQSMDHPGVTLTLEDWVEFLGLYEEKKTKGDLNAY